MKSLVVKVMLSLILTIGLSACGSDEKSDADTSSDPSTLNTVTDPAVTDPVVTDPVVADPVVTDPVVTDPVVTDPVVTDPVVTDPAVTDPAVTDPVVTDPVVTDPVDSDPEAISPDGLLTLNVIINGGQGSVISDDVNINCPTSCQHTYLVDKLLVTLTAAPAKGYKFVRFDEADAICANSAEEAANQAVCMVNLNQSKSISVVFEADDNFEGIPLVLPDPVDTPPNTNTPVKVYILSGQSNMVGMGEVNGGSERYSGYYLSETGAVKGLQISVYEGAYDSSIDYDKLTPQIVENVEFGGAQGRWPDYIGARTDIARGYFEAPKTGKYKIKPGYGGSTFNVMSFAGEEIYRKNLDEDITVSKAVDVVAGQRYPITITYFKKGWFSAWIYPQGVPGTLESITQAGLYPNLLDEKGNFTVRKDVWYKGVVSATANKWLTVGCGSNASTIGPELGFGHVMGYYHDEPVLIIKASIGNRSLGWDMLSPGSERYTVDGVTYAGYQDRDRMWSDADPYSPKDNWYAGKEYDSYVQETKKVLENFDTNFPAFKDQGYEIAGFGWFQGHKDSLENVYADRYELHMANFIKAFRAEFNAEDAPFVIASVGFSGDKMSGNTLTVANAQFAVSGDSGNYPEFSGNVLTVDTRDFWPDVESSPKNQGYHYHRNAETFIQVGDAMGRAMYELISNDR